MRPEGFEPPRGTPRDPKSRASTSSATAASRGESNIDEALAARYPYERAYQPTTRKLDGMVHSW